MLVLAVDEDDQDRSATARVLRQHGFTVLEAASGFQAVTSSLTAGRPVDVLVTDISMPDLEDGLRLARVLRRRYPQLPVLVTTGEVPARGPEGDDRLMYLAKPYRPQDLIRCMRLLMRAP